MEQILTGVLDAIVENEYKNFFNNLEEIFCKAYLSSYEFAKQSKNLNREDNPKEILVNYLEKFIKKCPQFNDRVNEDGSVSRALITSNALIGELRNDRSFYVSYFIKNIFEKANYNNAISKKEHLISYFWINFSGKYNLNDEK